MAVRLAERPYATAITLVASTPETKISRLSPPERGPGASSSFTGGSPMIVTPEFIAALSALATALAGLVWAFRRRR